MNVLKHRMNNTQSILVMQRGGPRNYAESYNKGTLLRATQDVDLQIEEGVASVPRGSLATILNNDSQNLLIDLGESLGNFVIPLSEIPKYFERAERTEPAKKLGESVTENYVTATPGAYVEITSYDPNIGPNRGPGSPGHGGYQTLVGQKGQLTTLFGQINGIKTYKIKLVYGGEFVFGETEFKVITGAGAQESADKVTAPLTESDYQALRAVGLGL